MDDFRGDAAVTRDRRRPEDRLAALGLVLPELSVPRGNYVRARRHGDLLFLAGHGPAPDAHGNRPVGCVGAELTLEAGYDAARRCALGLLATLKIELGELERIAAVLRVFGMVRCAPGFDATPKVIDGCSDLLVQVLGPEAGRHARSAVGVDMLPFGMPVEIEAVVAVR
jgi:enamine deaminase RidA (YjgF/YER057c/UK114 family)